MTTGTNNSGNYPYLNTDGQIPIGSSAGNPLAATITAGTGVTVTNGHNTITIASSGAGAGVALADTITQVAHGFSVQQLVYISGASTYALAKADTAAHAEVVGIVTTVTSSSVFVLTTSGYCTGLSGLTAGTVYFLDDATAGLLTATVPTTAGHINKPVFVADTATSGYFINFRGEVIPNAGTAITWKSAASSPITLVPYNGYTCNNGASLITFNIPATTAVGDTYVIAGTSTGKWLIQANTGQTINVGATASTTAGSAAAQNSFDSVTLVCTVASTTFVATSVVGNLTLA